MGRKSLVVPLLLCKLSPFPLRRRPTTASTPYCAPLVGDGGSIYSRALGDAYSLFA
jgi:hypothetical protein